MGLPYFSLYSASGNLEMAAFARTAYDFWFFRGTWGSTVQRIVSTLNVSILFAAVFFFTYMVNWEIALTCVEESCSKAGDLVSAPSRQFLDSSVRARWIAFVFLVASGAAVLWECSRVLRTYLTMCEFESHFVGDELIAVPSRTPVHRVIAAAHRWQSGYAEIADSPGAVRLEDTPWDEFLARLCWKVQHNDFPTVPNAETYDELKFIQLLLIEENHRVALAFGASAHSTVFESQPALRYLDDNIADLLVRQVLSSNYDLGAARDEIYLRVARNVFVALVASFLMWPFVSAFFFIKLIVKNLADLKSQPSSLLQRDFTPTARWKLRLFNEVHHLHSCRLKLGAELANEMASRSAMPNEFLRVVQRLGATIVAAVAVVSFLNAPILTFGVVWGKTLVWWLSIGAVAYAAGAMSQQPLREYQHMPDLRRLYRLLHYQRESWSVSASHFRRSITGDMLSVRLRIILESFLKVLLLPVTLAVLYRNPDAIFALIDALRAHRHTIDNIGDACSTSAFAPPRLEDQNCALGRKLAKSIAQFAAVYTAWARRQCAIAQIAAIHLELHRGLGRDWDVPPLCALFDKYRDASSNGVEGETLLLELVRRAHGIAGDVHVPDLEDWDTGECGVQLVEGSPYRLAIFVHSLLAGTAGATVGRQHAPPAVVGALCTSEVGPGATEAQPAQLLPQDTTAHDREQLLVSQLDDHFASKISRKVRARATALEHRSELLPPASNAPSQNYGGVAPRDPAAEEMKAIDR